MSIRELRRLSMLRKTSELDYLSYIIYTTVVLHQILIIFC